MFEQVPVPFLSKLWFAPENFDHPGQVIMTNQRDREIATKTFLIQSTDGAQIRSCILKILDPNGLMSIDVFSCQPRLEKQPELGKDGYCQSMSRNQLKTSGSQGVDKHRGGVCFQQFRQHLQNIRQMVADIQA